MSETIGYFIPEFPGQTHIFFWRERQILTELGIRADWVSTRRPPRAIASHSWAEEAQKNTAYLIPLRMPDFIGAIAEIIKAGPVAWGRCLQIVIQAHDLSLSQKLRLFFLIFMGAKLAWLAHKKNWSHIHVHSCADAANIAMFSSILSGIPYSLTLHGPTLEIYGPNQHKKWKYAAFGTVISQQLFQDINHKLLGCLPKTVAVAPMGVNLDEIKRQKPYISWEKGKECRIFSCGRLNPVKGHKYLIETVELLQTKGFKVRLQIAGEDEQGGSGYRQEIQRIIEEKSLSKSVELLGAVCEARVRQGLEEAHIFALASLNEGIPVSVMEAMAMEMPVIVTDVGGNSELIDNNIDAILVQPEKPEEMADAIVKVLQNQEIALKLSQESRQKIAAKFHHRRSAETLAQCLKAIV